MKKAAPMYGGRTDGLSVQDRVRIIKQTMADHDRRIEAAREIGREHLTFTERIETLTPAGKSLLRLVDSYLRARNLDDTLSTRLTAVSELAKLRMCEDVPASDVRVVSAATADAITRATQPETMAPHAPASAEPLAMKATDGTVLVGDDKEEALRLGGPTKGGERWTRLRAIAEKNGLNLSKPSDRRMGESWLFAEVAHPFFHGWQSLDEGVFVLQKSEKLSLADATRRVRELAPHLVDEPYGRRRTGSGDVQTFAQGPTAEEQLEAEVERLANSRGLNANVPSQRAVLMKEALAADPTLGKRLYYGENALNPDEGDDTPRTCTVVELAEHQAPFAKFEKLVDEALREQGVPRTYANVSKAAASVRKAHPHLVPQYGSGRKS